MIDPRGLPHHLLDLLLRHPDGLGQAAVAVEAVAQPDHLDARLAGHRGATLEHRVTGLDQPRPGADALHVPRHGEHHLVLLEVGLQAHPAVVAVRLRQAPSRLLRLVTAHQGGVEHEVGVPERPLALQGGLEAQVDAQLLDVAHRQAVDQLQTPLVHVHERDGAPVEGLGQAQVAHQPQRELRAPGPDHPQLDGLPHAIPLLGSAALRASPAPLLLAIARLRPAAFGTI
jgi:hypothetical protein